MGVSDGTPTGQDGGAMSHTDPRKIPGSMAGPGGPHDLGGVILDARNAVILETVDVSTIDPDRGGRGQHAVALVLGGRINQTKQRVSVLFILGTDGAASIVTELIGLYGRATGSPEPFINDVMGRIRTLREDGNLT
jgi:hypothetical protein